MSRSARSTDVGRLPSNTRASTWWAGTPSAMTSSRVLPNANASAWANRFAIEQVVVVADLRGGVDEPDEVRGHDVRALVEQLVVGVLAVGAGRAPDDRARVVGHPRAVEADGLAVRLHVQLLQVGREAAELLAVGQDRMGLEPEGVARTRPRAAP